MRLADLARVPARALGVAVLGVAWQCAVWPAAAAAEELLVRAALLHTCGPAGTLRDAAVWLRDGKVLRVGSAAELAAPAGIPVLEASVVTPGLIDAQGVTGLSGAYNVAADQDQDERSGPNQAALRAIDAFHPDELLLRWLRRHGVTALQAGPGEANPIGGQAGVFKTAGSSADAMTLRFPSALVFTLGELPKQTYQEKGQPPLTRMGTAGLIRKALLEAALYARDRGEDDGKLRVRLSGRRPDKPPARNLGHDALARVLRREIPALFTVRREDDIETALRIGEEFGLDVQLADAVEAYLMRERLKSAAVPVLVGPVIGRNTRMETLNHSVELAVLLQETGIPIAFRSGFEGYVPKTRLVLFEAAVAVAAGLPDQAALRALTSEAARLLGVDARIGSLQPGKDADLVLFDGDPFEYTTHVEATLVDGQIAYRRGEEGD